MGKTRPSRIYSDDKGYYIRQGKVKRYFDENDLTKIVEALKMGKLKNKTSKKGKTWLDQFKPQEAPVNRDIGFLPGELTPIERRKIEKARWDVYGHAVEQMKRDSEENSKRMKIIKQLEEKRREIEKQEYKYEPPKQDKPPEQNKNEYDIPIGYEDIMKSRLKKGKDLLDIDVKITAGKGINISQEMKELLISYDDINKEIINEATRIIKNIGFNEFEKSGFDKLFEGTLLHEKSTLNDLFIKRSNIDKEIHTLLYEGTNIQTGYEESKYEKEIKEFLNSITLKELKEYIKYISTIGFSGGYKDDYIKFILSDPKLSKIAQLAYIKLAENAIKTDSRVTYKDFYNTSLEIKKTAVGFGESDYEGLYGDEIIKIMKPYKGFLGVIMNDEIPDLIKDSLHYDRFGFVINTDNHDQEGSHWCAIFVDIPDGSIEYFDSFGDEPSETIKKDMMDLIEAHKINYLMKFKVNGAKVQDLRTGSCGWFAMKFLIDRFNGVPFDIASGFRVKSIGSKKGESSVNKMKKSFGYI